jgi:hypothetical protein
VRVRGGLRGGIQAKVCQHPATHRVRPFNGCAKAIERDPREARLDEPHVRPLMDLVCSLRARGYERANALCVRWCERRNHRYLTKCPSHWHLGSGLISPSARTITRSRPCALLAAAVKPMRKNMFLAA